MHHVRGSAQQQEVHLGRGGGQEIHHVRGPQAVNRQEDILQQQHRNHDNAVDHKVSFFAIHY